MKYLNEKRAVGDGEGCEDVLEYFAEPGTVDTCHARREPGLADSPTLDA